MAAAALLNMRMTDEQRIRLLLDDRVECFAKSSGCPTCRLRSTSSIWRHRWRDEEPKVCHSPLEQTGFEPPVPVEDATGF
jgi:hypothetical protein